MSKPRKLCDILEATEGNSQGMFTSSQDKPDDSWYSSLAIEPWEIIERNGLNFFEGSALKYLLRWRGKNGVEDLRKVKVYVDELIAMEGRMG